MPAETAKSTPPFTIAKFDKALHDRSAFSCGFKPIDNFLKSSLSDQIKNNFVAAWMATSDTDKAVLGFYTLNAMAVSAKLALTNDTRSTPPEIPVIYIRAVGVREDMQGKGLGTALLMHAMHRCMHIADDIGAAAITLDVLEDDKFERRWQFYERLGFSSLRDPENQHRVYISIADVRHTLG